MSPGSYAVRNSLKYETSQAPFYSLFRFKPYAGTSMFCRTCNIADNET